jgi:hypothetical protein
VKTGYLGLILVALILASSTAMAYEGFNSRYYTDNYYQTNYVATPAQAAYPYNGSNGYYSYNYAYGYGYPYVYNTRYYNTQPAMVIPSYSVMNYYPAYYPSYYNSYYPTYYGGYLPATTYSGIGVYSTGTGGWGVSITRGSICGYYGYC